MSDLISREKLLNEINLLKKSPWYNKDFAAVKLVRKDAVAIVEKCVEEAPGVAEWISVKDRLPEENGFYLVYIVANSCPKNRQIITLYFSNLSKRFIYGSDEIFTVTHWQYLPEPPKERNDE